MCTTRVKYACSRWTIRETVSIESMQNVEIVIYIPDFQFKPLPVSFLKKNIFQRVMKGEKQTYLSEKADHRKTSNTEIHGSE